MTPGNAWSLAGIDSVTATGCQAAASRPGDAQPANLLGGVVGLAGQELAFDVRPEGGLPRAVGGDGLDRAVGQFDFKLGEQPRPVAVDVLAAPADLPGVPAGAKHAADGVRAVRL